MRPTTIFRNVSFAAALAAATALSTAPASAESLKLRIPGFFDLKLGDRYKGRMSAHIVRRHLRHKGYRNISALRYVRHRGRDFYRTTAWRGRWQYRLTVSDETAEVVNRTRLRHTGAYDRGHGYGRHHARLDRRDVRRQLRARGYRKIRNIRYVNRGRNDFYVATARRYGHAYRVRVSDETGRLLGARRIR